MSPTEQHDMHTLTGAYAVDALDDLERQAFEDHLRDCASCTEEVASLRATAARLGATERVEPSEAFRASVMADVRRTRQLPPLVDTVAVAARRSRWIAVAAVAAALLVVGGTLGGVAWREHRSAQQAQVEASGVTAVLAAPDARTMRAAAAKGGSGTVVWSAQRDAAVFVASDLPPLAQGRAYQLWVINDAGPRPEPVLTMTTTGASRPVVAHRLTGGVSMAVTVEPTGGSAKPSSDPVLVVPLS